jgi:hypothetical protein
MGNFLPRTRGKDAFLHADDKVEIGVSDVGVARPAARLGKKRPLARWMRYTFTSPRLQRRCEQLDAAGQPIAFPRPPLAAMASSRTRDPTLAVGPIANEAVERLMRAQAEERRKAQLKHVGKSIDNGEPATRQLSHLKANAKRQALVDGASAACTATAPSVNTADRRNYPVAPTHPSPSAAFPRPRCRPPASH